jgi:hypothetical protein
MTGLLVANGEWMQCIRPAALAEVAQPSTGWSQFPRAPYVAERGFGLVS